MKELEGLLCPNTMVRVFARTNMIISVALNTHTGDLEILIAPNVVVDANNGNWYFFGCKTFYI